MNLKGKLILHSLIKKIINKTYIKNLFLFILTKQTLYQNTISYSYCSELSYNNNKTLFYRKPLFASKCITKRFTCGFPV